MSLDDAFSEFFLGVANEAARLKKMVTHYAAPPFEYDALHVLALDHACDYVIGSDADGNDIGIPPGTLESIIRLVRLCAALESYYSWPEPPQSVRDAVAQTIIEALGRVHQNA